MKKFRLLLFGIGVFILIGAPKVDALRIFKYIESEGYYICVYSGPSLDLSLESTYNIIQDYNTCVNPNTPVSNPAQKGECKNLNGTFYPAIVTDDEAININNNTTVNYLLIAYNFPININAKVSFIDDGGVLGTIGENGRIVINENAGIEFSNMSEKLYGNTNDYQMSFGTDSFITYKTLAVDGEVFPIMDGDTDAIPAFLNNITTMSDYVELKGNFKINNPFTLFTHVDGFGSKLILKENSTLDLLSDFTIDNKSKMITESNSKLLNSSILNVGGKLDINGTFYNGYKLDNSNSPITTNTGSVTIGRGGKITLIGNVTGLNNSENDIPVTLDSEDPTTPPIEGVIPSNRPKSITINSDITNGVVSASKSSATSGETITLTITPATRYKIKSIKILKGDNTDVTSSVNYNSTNKTFTMPNYNVKISAVFEEINYSYFEESEEQTYKINKDDKLEFKLKPDYSLFENGGKVYVDDELVDQKYITSKSGSTIITLSKEYLDKLSIGNHTLKVTFNTDESAETIFTISREEPNPKTGDGIMNFIFIGSISLIGLLGISIYLKKKRFN